MKKDTALLSADLRNLGLIAEPEGAGVHIKDFLVRKGLTAADAARDLGVAKSTITRLLNGESELSIDLAIKLKKTYNAPIDLLFRLEAEYKAWCVHKRLEVA
ncbi:helix-turn-helix transcriptional regulator [Rheinheimera sp. MM224]|uniref:helix-turn-helix transcriptional regulator n=1 Tax=Rheinheimera sp. MM224 TaxID=3019969 RepID=UPI0021F8E467|nr:helix-turn-helix domain-containing protein [Rheinheimera sp. MM224]CAI3797678.1 hypothetical protein JAMGFMIE_01880 [Rheinheimera sp. MM224]